ncbi:phosphotransferase [Glycomyces sp. NPDC047010]|uniref:phosphotransferase n=1 Tax=Glycomyces sp. NPDC047010 TaxID=3155023 RepID=UPI0033D9EC53
MHLLSSGRASKVYALSDNRVLRRCSWDLEPEARLMAHLRDQGYPVPEVFRIDGNDMTMERLHGPTLAEDLFAGRVAPPAAAALMLDLLERLHRIPAPDWLPGETRGLDLNGRSVLHLDMHPENIIGTADGPVVIDWTNAAAGDPAVDRAVSWTILAELDPESLPLDPAPLRDPFAHTFSATALDTALRFRDADTGITEAEHARARALAAL